MRLSTQLSAVSAAGLATAVWLLGPWAVRALTDLAPVRALALELVPHTAIYVALSFAAFQLDGIFIGATATRDMRNASALSCLAFLALSLLLMPSWGNRGLWWAFVAFVVLRALALAARYPAIRSRVDGGVAR